MSKDELYKSVEELEAKQKALADQIASTASLHIQMTNEIEKLKPELVSLKEEKETISKAIDTMKAQIQSRCNEREAELNARAEIVNLGEEQNTAEASRLFHTATKLEEKEKAVDLLIEHARILENSNRTDKLLNESLTVEIKSKQEKLDRLLDETAAKAVHMEEVTRNANDEITSHRNKGLVLDEKIKSCQAAEDNAIAMAEDMAQKAAALEKALALVKGKEQENIDCAAALEKKQQEIDSFQASQTQTFNEANKKIELAWLQINKKIQDKQLDLQIEELKK